MLRKFQIQFNLIVYKAKWSYHSKCQLIFRRIYYNSYQGANTFLFIPFHGLFFNPWGKNNNNIAIWWRNKAKARENRQDKLKELRSILALCLCWSACQCSLLSPLQRCPEYQQRLLWFPVFHWSAGSPPAAKGWAAVASCTVTGTKVEMTGPVHPVIEGWSFEKALLLFLALWAWVACPASWKGMAELGKGFVGWTDSVQEMSSGVGMEPEWVETMPLRE